ncbi:MAG TPA: hypothetical protein VGM54_02330 [Chthoniobacter sp.]|jgi:hypothetical protein
MKTPLSLIVLFLVVLLDAPGALREAAKPATPAPIPDELHFHIAADFDFDSFDGYLRQLEKAVEYKIECPEDVAPVVRKSWDGEQAPWENLITMGRYPMPVAQYLNATCADLCLTWAYHPESKTIVFDVPWRRSDRRTGQELLEYVLKRGRDSRIDKDKEWQDAFNALLSKEGNIAKAAPVCQETIFASFHFTGPNGQLPPLPDRHLVFRAPVVDVIGNHYLLFAFHQAKLFASRGSVSYFWFRDDGTLAGAGLLSTGDRCQLMGGSVRSGAATDLHEKPSDVQLEISNMEAHFLLRGDGLKLTRLNDVLNDELNDVYSIGKNLLKENETAREKAPEGPDTYTLEFPKDADLETLKVVTYLSRPMDTGDPGFTKYHPQEKVADGRCTIATGEATSLKAVIFGPRYQVAQVDVALSGKDSSRSMAVTLKPQPAIRFTGKIEFPEGVDPTQYRLEAIYYGRWAAAFLHAFGEPPVPSFTAASMDLQADGSFAASVPDMLHDPATGVRPNECAFTLILRDKKSGHVPYELQVDGTTGSDVRIAETYDAVKIHALRWDRK